MKKKEKKGKTLESLKAEYARESKEILAQDDFAQPHSPTNEKKWGKGDPKKFLSAPGPIEKRSKDGGFNVTEESPSLKKSGSGKAKKEKSKKESPLAEKRSRNEFHSFSMQDFGASNVSEEECELKIKFSDDNLLGLSSGQMEGESQEPLSRKSKGSETERRLASVEKYVNLLLSNSMDSMKMVVERTNSMKLHLESYIENVLQQQVSKFKEDFKGQVSLQLQDNLQRLQQEQAKLDEKKTQVEKTTAKFVESEHKKLIQNL